MDQVLTSLPPMPSAAAREHDLRAMKRRATGLLAAMTLAFVVVASLGTDDGWMGYLRAGVEASMVGGLADWFAVTALFRHPLGIPIPHTAVIKSRKDQFGATLGEFVQENFLSADAIGERVRQSRAIARAADWLARPENARVVAGHAAEVVVGLADLVRDEDVHQLLETEIRNAVDRVPLAPLAGRALEFATAEGRHQQLFDAVVRGVQQYLGGNRESLRLRFGQQSPWWLPGAVEDRIFDRLLDGFEDLLDSVSVDPNHELRQHFDARVIEFAQRLQHDPELRDRGEQLKHELLAHPQLRAWTASVWTDVKVTMRAQADDPDSAMRRRIAEALAAGAVRLRDDPQLQEKADDLADAGVRYVVSHFHDELAALVSGTIARWDADETSWRLELLLGRDLQFIRINGTVVGGIAGVAIHAIGEVLQNWRMRFAVVGAGMAGILSAIKLVEAGLTDFTVYEKGDRVGGTWRENTYPGLSCDVPSHLYSYSFALNPEWSHTFSPGAEIRAYFERVARENDVEQYMRFGDEVVRCEYRDGRWHVDTAAGHHDVVDVVIAATGVLHHPRYPDIEGLDTFAGACFHSARWDHDVLLDGARVGVIGTGSTAVQLTCALADRVGHYSLFQRTAQWVVPSTNRPYTPDEIATFRRDPNEMVALHDKLSTLFADGFANAVVDRDSPVLQMVADVCRANLEDNVPPGELRERLRPDYRAGCKRLVVADDFYGAIQRPNAELVTARIERVEDDGVRTADGVLHDLDVLVLATGFQVDAFMRPMTVVGHSGVRLDEVWAKRPSAYLSISIPDFPNFFMLNGPNGPVGNFSLIEVAELQFAYIMQLVDRLLAGECRAISATHAATEAHETARAEAAQHTVWATGCNSWYLDDRGVPAAWPWTFDRFREAMAAPNLDAFDFVS